MIFLVNPWHWIRRWDGFNGQAEWFDWFCHAVWCAQWGRPDWASGKSFNLFISLTRTSRLVLAVWRCMARFWLAWFTRVVPQNGPVHFLWRHPRVCQCHLPHLGRTVSWLWRSDWVANTVNDSTGVKMKLQWLSDSDMIVVTTGINQSHHLLTRLIRHWPRAWRCIAWIWRWRVCSII